MDDTTRTAVETCAAPLDAPAVETCACGDPLFGGTCLNVGACRTADGRGARYGRGATAKVDPAAWTVSGGVD